MKDIMLRILDQYKFVSYYTQVMLAMFSIVRTVYHGICKWHGSIVHVGYHAVITADVVFTGGLLDR